MSHELTHPLPLSLSRSACLFFSLMAESKSVKTLEVCRVAPSTSPSQFPLPLTFMDMFWVRLDPASRLFFYELTEPNALFLETILPRLKNSLSVALQQYLPLAGNLTWPQGSDKPVVQYRTGDGVSLTVAETDADFRYLSGDGFRDSSKLHSLLPEFPTSETRNPVLTLQITLFPGTGFSVGYVGHHGVMDGKSVSMFIRSWAYICKNGDDPILPPELTPSFDRTFVEQQTELERVFPRGVWDQPDPESKVLPTFDIRPPPDTVLGTFRLSRQDIDTLKSKLNPANCVSTLTVTSAYAMVCLVKAKRITNKQTFIGINVDARARMDPPIAPTYFGNCVIFSGGGRGSKDFLSEDGFAIAVEVVSKALAKLNEGAVKVTKDINGSLFEESVVFVVAGSPRFELYGADFGWGRPRKVEMISIAKSGAFYLSDNRDDSRGIEVGIALKKGETEAFASAFASGIHTC